MKRPCNCNLIGCHLCWLAKWDRRYRRLWGIESQPVEQEDALMSLSEGRDELERLLSTSVIPRNEERGMRWAYGITTTTFREKDLFPRTLLSLQQGGFGQPRVFLDWANARDAVRYEDTYGLPVTLHGGEAIRTHGNWVLSMYELYIREPNADRYILFQDDIIVYKNLREYLEKRGIVNEAGYYNLYSFPSNEYLSPSEEYVGWMPSNQFGRGAVALMFTRDALLVLLQSEHMMRRPENHDRGWKAVDGGIVDAMRKAGYKEFVHYPSLLQHEGILSSMGNHRHPMSNSFRGEGYDAMDLLKAVTA